MIGQFCGPYSTLQHYSSHQCQFNPKIFAMGTKQCPVRYLQILETSLFFVAINHNACRTKSTRYKLLQIGQFLPKLACKPMDENFPTIPRLLDAGIPENFVTQLSGHKNLQSLSSYKSASLAPQRQMSDSLRQQIPPPN